MHYNSSKIEPLFQYCLENGFNHSMQKIADAVHITKKTLFNRYISKENLELCLMDYWQTKTNERMAQSMEFANNAVEKLMMFLFELQYCKNNESLFFQKTKEIFSEKFVQNSPHIKQLEIIFKTGIEEELFQFDSDPKVFTYFFLFNTLFLLLSDNLIYTEFISFLIDPILTQNGKAVFKDIDIEQVFKKS
jgi:AcrR family transcriptional regulator